MNNSVARPDEIVVHALKYDGSLHRAWKARLMRREDSLIVLEGVFEREVRHALLGHIARGTLSTEYFWLNRWYNVFRFREPTGEMRNFYCNINQPARLSGHTLSFVDLDLDVLVAPDFSYKILDRDEFTINAARFRYPPEILSEAEKALAALVSLIERRAFPFSDRLSDAATL